MKCHKVSARKILSFPSRIRIILYPLSFILLLFSAATFAQQIAIPRIEQMPNLPQPYQMRNWKQVALGFDSLAFKLTASGQYLPLIFRQINTVNYPNHDSFGIHSYVGTNSPNSGEAITGLPAVVGASLVGINKKNQNSQNWVLRCEEFFNRRPEENIYLNGPVANSGSDWWYETMPNVFFYQLYDLYPGTGDFANQFTTVADQWLRATEAMGGSATPWNKAFMDYRAWSFATMTPLTTGVKEPEAAGAIAWLLFNAYLETGEERYRMGAEWAMEFLNGRTTNPSYELQLPYGVYAAAKMNATIGTQYDVEKMLNWCFTIGPLRQWGAIVGTWGGYDVSGLIGESISNEYAFVMNGYQQAGALVPMCRYDDRFTRAIGKWVLNVANASRLFYPNYLPPENQDSEEWSFQYDPNSTIAHEALREELFGKSPYATGDAIGGGWAQTNLGLYGSSHVGYLAGILDTTDVSGVLKLDMLKTDFFRNEAYPTYLLYNPHVTAQNVSIDVGSNSVDLYDAVSNTFLQTGVSGVVSVAIPADEALQLVLAPAGGVVSYHFDEMRIDGVTVDYSSGQAVTNYPPRIKALAVAENEIYIGETIAVYCAADDRDGDTPVFNWNATDGQLSGSGATVNWTAPDSAGTAQITCIVSDGNGGADTSAVIVSVTDNRLPQISALSATPEIIDVAETAQLTCLATDPDGDSLSYDWSAAGGTFSGSGAAVEWIAPATPGYYVIVCTVSDGKVQVSDSVSVTAGRLVGQYGFSGNAADESGFGNNGIVSGAILTDDRFGNPNSAYFFDGSDDQIRVPLHPSLNFSEAITVAFWLQKSSFTGAEEFPISHGSWQNRWKVSIIPDKKLRWTINTDAGIYDLDTPAAIAENTLYFVAATFGDGQMKIFLNGQEANAASRNGNISATNLDLTIGQMVPGNTQYGFRGVLDDVRIYNRVLSPAEIMDLFNLTGIGDDADGLLPKTTALEQNYPNPFNPTTSISYKLSNFSDVKLRIFNVLGQSVKTLVDEKLPAGSYTISWDGTNASGEAVASGIYFYRLTAGETVLIRKMLLVR
ncbi:MAG: LamG-like jellyroll fold domain-containing protein [Calditrichia bacterium]